MAIILSFDSIRSKSASVREEFIEPYRGGDAASPRASADRQVQS
jgi:hypothetical protein